MTGPGVVTYWECRSRRAIWKFSRCFLPVEFRAWRERLPSTSPATKRHFDLYMSAVDRVVILVRKFARMVLEKLPAVIVEDMTGKKNLIR